MLAETAYMKMNGTEFKPPEVFKHLKHKIIFHKINGIPCVPIFLIEEATT